MMQRTSYWNICTETQIVINFLQIWGEGYCYQTYGILTCDIPCKGVTNNISELRPRHELLKLSERRVEHFTHVVRFMRTRYSEQGEVEITFLVRFTVDHRSLLSEGESSLHRLSIGLIFWKRSFSL